MIGAIIFGIVAIPCMVIVARCGIWQARRDFFTQLGEAEYRRAMANRGIFVGKEVLPSMWKYAIFLRR